MRALPFVVAITALTACESEDPRGTPFDAGPADTITVDAAVDTAAGDTGDAAVTCTTEVISAAWDNGTCKPLASDYAPGAEDTWPVCISDDGLYHRFGDSIGTATRIDAFERIAAKLSFGSDATPSPTDFIAAREIFAEPEGLLSRVSRREDEHYPPAAMACRDLSPADQLASADRCVGPAKLMPILNEAFEKGAKGEEPGIQAARIEAAILWFLYLSPYKEARTCTTTTADCDSSYAYYTGGQAREGGLGFSRYVRSRSKQAHDAIWNGILAVRCWRDLDPATVAADITLRDKAVGQLDRALHRGLAVIIAQRLSRRTCGASWTSTRILGTALDREATARDASKAAILRAEFTKTDPATVDAKALLTALDALFPCPF